MDNYRWAITNNSNWDNWINNSINSIKNTTKKSNSTFF